MCPMEICIRWTFSRKLVLHYVLAFYTIAHYHLALAIFTSGTANMDAWVFGTPAYWHMNALLLEIGSWAFQHFGTAILGKILNFTTSNPPLPSCGWLCVLIRWFHSAVIHFIVVLSIGCLLDIFASHPYLWKHKLADKLVPIFCQVKSLDPDRRLSLSLWGMPPLKSKDLVRNRNIHIANPRFCKAQRI